MRGHRDEKARGHRRERDPEAGVLPARGRRCGAVGTHIFARRMPSQRPAAGEQCNEQAKADRPRPCLVAEPHERLDHDRIGYEREEASDIAGGIEEIGVFRGGVVCAREPGLEQRAIGSKGKKRQADRGCEQSHQPQRFRGCRRAVPAGGDRQWQRECSGDHHC